MVHVTVVFNYEEQRWTRGFEVDDGSTVLQLKESMLNPRGEQEDVEAFELRQLGRRVPDFEQIQKEHTFDFEYLGPELGSQRAREDQRRQAEWERLREGAHAVPGAPGAARRQQPPGPKGGEAAPGAAAAPAPAPVAAAPLPEGEHEVVVTIDRALGLTCSVRVRGGATVLRVKERLAEQDSTGGTRVSDFGLAVLGGVAGQVPAALPDGTVLTAGHLQLQTTEAPAARGPPPAEAQRTGEEEEFYRPVPAPRPKATARPPALAPKWEVVGGADKGGILVREGQSTKSPQLEDRLATGALVEELAVEGERLRYRKLSGAGPAEGWVSLAVSGKELLVPRKPTPEELFTLDRAFSLQEELMEGFARLDFQRALSRLLREHPGKPSADFLRKRGELFLTVQSVVLPKYGFEGSPTGVVQMMSAFNQHQCGEVGWNNDQLNKLLRM